MPRTFAYVRVSALGLTARNQAREIEGARFAAAPRRIVAETVSGSEANARRREFGRLLDRLQAGNVLVVIRLDRLGRGAMDVTVTAARLAEMGARVHCLALGGVDLTSSPGCMTVGVVGAAAQFERGLPIERTQAASPVPARRARSSGGPSRCAPTSAPPWPSALQQGRASRPSRGRSAPRDRRSCGCAMRPGGQWIAIEPVAYMAPGAYPVRRVMEHGTPGPAASGPQAGREGPFMLP